jgi:hypothetical protein
MQYETIEDPVTEFNEQLRMELGWGEVASGLTKVLLGYTTMFLGVTIGLGLVIFALYGLGVDFGRRAFGAVGHKPALGHLWALYSGLGILSIIGLVSYGIIIGGLFRCMLGAAERHGARWFMFMCIACVFLVPAFQVGAGIANWQAVADLKANPHRIDNFQLNPMGQWLQVMSFGISMLYPMCFMLFLRSVAVCLRVEWQVMLINTFLVLAGILTAVTGFALYVYRPGAKLIPAEQALLLGGGWLVVMVLYVGLIALTRVTISKVMGGVKSPLAV